MLDVDAGSGDRLVLVVLAQYRMTTTKQMHLMIAPGVRIEQTRRRLVKLRKEGLVDRILTTPTMAPPTPTIDQTMQVSGRRNRGR